VPIRDIGGRLLDRDGVLTRERPDYVKTPNELEILAGDRAPPARAAPQNEASTCHRNQPVGCWKRIRPLTTI